MNFDFRLDVCVPTGLFMYARQRTLCVANWTSGPYTFMLPLSRHHQATRSAAEMTQFASRSWT